MKAPTLTLALALALCGCNRGEPAPSPVVQPVEEDVATVPERFRGDWAADADACTTPGHVSRLHIGSDRIRFHESEGPIVSVDERGDALTLVARLTGEGETRDASYAFSLSGDGNTLSDANGFTRQRCD